MPEENATIDEIFRKLNTKSNLLYQFVLAYGDMIAARRDYGTGELVNMAEVHLLTAVDDNPGITVTRLAAMWNRTKGAVSQTVAKLEKKAYLSREKEQGNAKSVHFYVTEKGRKLSSAHKVYDSIDITTTTEALLQSCTMAEIDAFYKVIGAYLGLLQGDDA